MKKLFTFVVAVVITTMAFGQFENVLTPTDQPIPAVQEDRTGWIGGMEDYDRLFRMSEGDKVAMRLPAAGALPAGDLSVTKVAFRWQPDFQGDPMGKLFRVLIYAGGSSDWIEEGQNRYITMDTTVQGVLLYAQDYECIVEGWSTDLAGWQTVELARPVAIPSNQEIWIAVQALEASGVIADLDENKQHPEWWGQHVFSVYATLPDQPAGWCWATAGFSGGNETMIPCKFGLKVLFNDGDAYVNTTDWSVGLYSAESLPTLTTIDRLYVDQFMMADSLYLYPFFLNWGPDVNVADAQITMYVEGRPDIVFLNTTFSQIFPEGVEATINLGPMTGYDITWLDGHMAFRDMEQMGLTFPFYVCCNFNSLGRDPNPSNNTACVKVTDRETDDDPGVGISETSNALNISPNPASTYIKVTNAAGSRIAVYNIAGQEVLSVASAEANETLNVSHLTAGLYIVRVVNGTEVSTAKVSIVR